MTNLILAFELDGLPPIECNGSHGHWAMKATTRAKWKRLAIQAIMTCREWQSVGKPLDKAKITLIRRSSVMGDADNAVVSFKPLVDALVTCRVIRDDKWSVIGQPELRFEKAKPGHGSVRVEVWA